MGGGNHAEGSRPTGGSDTPYDTVSTASAALGSKRCMVSQQIVEGVGVKRRKDGRNGSVGRKKGRRNVCGRKNGRDGTVRRKKSKRNECGRKDGRKGLYSKEETGGGRTDKESTPLISSGGINKHTQERNLI